MDFIRNFSDFELPHEVIEANLKTAAGREFLAHNQFLPSKVRAALARDLTLKSSLSFLPESTVTWSIFNAALQNPRFVERLSDPERIMQHDRFVNEGFNLILGKRTLSKAAARRILDSGVPAFISALLLRSDTPLTMRLECLPNAWRNARMGWLLSKQGSAVSDGEAWRIMQHKTFPEEHYDSTMLGTSLRNQFIAMMVSLLRNRPSLVDYALGSEDPVVLYAVSAIPLNAEQQLKLIDSSLKIYGGGRRKTLNYDVFQWFSGDTPYSPVVQLLSAPWCTAEAENEALKYPDEFEMFREGAKIVHKRAEYSYMRPETITEGFSRVNLKTGTFKEVMSSITRSPWFGGFHIQSVMALETLKRTDLTPAERKRLWFYVAPDKHIKKVLKIRSTATLASIVPLVAEKMAYTTNPHDRDEPRVPKHCLQPYATARDYNYGTNDDRGLTYLSSCNLTPAEWEVLLALDMEDLSFEEAVSRARELA